MFRSPFLSLQFGVEPTSIGIMRLGLGLALIYDLADRWPEIETWQTDWGLMPRVNLIEARYYRPSLHLASGHGWFQMLLHCVHLGAAVALTLGYRTRLAAIACWLLTVSLQNRNPLVPPACVPLARGSALAHARLWPRLCGEPSGHTFCRRSISCSVRPTRVRRCGTEADVQILHCGDDLLRNMLLWTVFLDAGEQLSLDNVIRYDHMSARPRPRPRARTPHTDTGTTKSQSRSPTSGYPSLAGSAWPASLCTCSCGPSTSAGARERTRCVCARCVCARGVHTCQRVRVP
jgi:hypothetical protein